MYIYICILYVLLLLLYHQREREAKGTCMSPMMGDAWVPTTSVTWSREGWYVKVMLVIYYFSTYI